MKNLVQDTKKRLYEAECSFREIDVLLHIYTSTNPVSNMPSIQKAQRMTSNAFHLVTLAGHKNHDLLVATNECSSYIHQHEQKYQKTRSNITNLAGKLGQKYRYVDSTMMKMKRISPVTVSDTDFETLETVK